MTEVDASPSTSNHDSLVSIAGSKAGSPAALPEAPGPEYSRKHSKILEYLSNKQPSPLENFYIDDVIRDQILFKEELEVIQYGSANSIGTATIKIMREGPCRAYFLIRSSVRATINKAECGATIISCVNRRFQTINERRTEYAIPEHEAHCTSPIDQSVFLAREELGYYCTAKEKHGHLNHVCKKESQISYDFTKYLIAEGANLLLLRYLAIIGYCGSFEAVTVLLDGKLRITSYTCSGPEERKINGQNVSVVIVERIILTSKYCEEHLTTILSRTGQELEHTWDDGTYQCRVRSWQGIDSAIIDETVNYAIPLHLRWENDMEMMSKYKDKVVRQKAAHFSFLLDHPELRDIISDFVQSLLLLKPKQVVPFAIDFFKAFQYDDTIEQQYVDKYAEKTPREVPDYQMDTIGSIDTGEEMGSSDVHSLIDTLFKRIL